MGALRDLAYSAAQIVALQLLVPLYLVLLLADALSRLLCCCRRRRAAPPKHVLITGATSGIGEDLAKLYAKRYGSDGIRLALTGRNAAALEATAKACAALGATVRTLRADVLERDKLAAWIGELDAEAPLELVIANAGVTERSAGVYGNLEESARRMIDTVSRDGGLAVLCLAGHW